MATTTLTTTTNGNKKRIRGAFEPISPLEGWIAAAVGALFRTKKRKTNDDDAMTAPLASPASTTTTTTTIIASGTKKSGTDGVTASPAEEEEEEKEEQEKARVDKAVTAAAGDPQGEHVGALQLRADDTYSSTQKDGADLLMRSCRRMYDWNDLATARILRAYLQFVQLTTTLVDQDHVDFPIYQPSRLVELMWRAHILDTDRYYHPTLLLYKNVRMPRYNPRAVPEGPERAKRLAMTHKVLLEHFGPDQVDRDIWELPANDDDDSGASNNHIAVPSFHWRSSDIKLHVTGLGALNKSVSIIMNKHDRLVDVLPRDGIWFAKGRRFEVDATPKSLRLRSDDEIVRGTGDFGPDVYELRLHAQGGEVTRYKTSARQPLRILFDMVAAAMGVEVSSLRFLKDGERLGNDTTPKQESLCNLDLIDVMLAQVGC